MAIENHVTRERQAQFNALVGIASLDDFPPLNDHQIAYLKSTYVPRCWDPSKETDVMHLRYAGKVELAQALIEHSEKKRPNEDFGLDPEAEQAGD